jgi:hypothetical protein
MESFCRVGGFKMIAPHQWPKNVKRLVLTGTTAIVIVAYLLLCLGITVLAGILLSQVGP